MTRTVLLGDICDIKIGRTPPRKQPQWFSESHGIKWVSIKDMGNTGKYISQTSEFLTADAIKKFNIPIIPAGTLLMSFKLTVGRLGFTEYDTCSNEAIAQLPIKDPDIVDKNYLYYYLKNFNFGSLSSTSSIATAVNSKTVKNISVSLPPLDRQKKIANILGSLDEKIELNRRMNETLEQLGQTIFRYHFIANPEVKNWPIVKVGDILSELQSGSRPKGGAVELGVPSIGAENIIGLGKYDYSKEKYISEDFFNKLSRGIVNSEDVLLYKDGAYVGKKSLFMNGFPHKKCAVNEHVFILRTNPKLRSQFFLYFWLDQSSITKKIIDAGVKAAQPGINQSNVNSLPILLPPEESVKKFDNEISPIMEMIFSNAVESNHLATFRDALLPKLISGEIEA